MRKQMDKEMKMIDSFPSRALYLLTSFPLFPFDFLSFVGLSLSLGSKYENLEKGERKKREKDSEGKLIRRQMDKEMKMINFFLSRTLYLLRSFTLFLFGCLSFFGLSLSFGSKKER